MLPHQSPTTERRRSTKIVATLGPASSDPQTLERMISAGVDVIRFNFSHGGDEADRLMRAQTVREAADKANLRVDQLSHLFSVQPRGWIPGAIAQHLGLPLEAALTTYEDYAHLGACGPIVNWQTAHRTGRLTPASRLALYAQGAGFTRGAAILEHA